MKKSFLFSVLLLMTGVLNQLSAQISYGTAGSNYTQNFDGVLSTVPADNTTQSTPALPTGWVFTEAGSNANTTYRVHTGATTTGDTHLFGATSNTERALGGFSSGSLTTQWGAFFTNNTGSTLTQFTLSYTGEQWKDGGSGTAILNTETFAYAINPTSLTSGTYTNVTQLDFTALVNNTSADVTLNGNLAANQRSISYTVTGISWPAGQTLYIRWTDINETGNDDGLGIDNVTFSADVTPTAAITVTPTSLSAFNYIQGAGPSASQTYNLSGVNLSPAAGNLTVTGSTDYEVSTNNSTFSNSVTVAYTGGTLAATPIYVRLKAGLVAGNYNAEVIANSGGGATTKNVTVSGTVSAPIVPTITLTPASLSGLSYVITNGPSTSQSYNLSGANLSPAAGNLTVSGSTNYEISTDNSTFGNSLSVAYTGSTLAATPIYVRLKAGLALGAYNSEVIANSGGGASTQNATISGSVVTSVASDIVAVASSESATVSSIINNTISAVSDGTQVWQFDIRDGGASLNDADNLSTIVSAMTFTQASGNAVNDWNDAIQSIQLFDGATLIAATTTVTTTQIQFTGLNINVADNSSKRISVRLTLQPQFNNSGSNLDGDDFMFTLTNANLTLSAAGSGKLSSFTTASSTNGQNVISVVATRLAFGQQPSTTSINSIMSPVVTVRATDINGNLDLDYTGAVFMSSTGTLNGAPVVVSAVAGVVSFTSLTHTVAGTGLLLNASASGLSNITSNAFDVLNQTTFLPGDLVLVAYDNNTGGGNDYIQILSFVPVVNGTNFQWANATYETGGHPAANVRNDRWYSCVATPTGLVPYFNISYIGAGVLPAGTLFCFNTDNGGTASAVTAVTPSGTTISSANFTVTAQNSAGTTVPHGDINVSTSSPDAMFLTQGTWTNVGGSGGYTTFTGNVLFGVQDGGTWYDITTNLSSITADANRRSRIHPQIYCSYLQANTSPATYVRTYNNTVTVASQSSILNAVLNYGNWTSTTPSCPSSSPFVINGTNGGTSRWTGAQNMDWFDCRNWENRTVPTATMDAEIQNNGYNTGSYNLTVSNKCQIDVATFSTTAARYQNIATCRNLLINGGDDDSEKLQITDSRSNRLDVYGNLTIGTGRLDMSSGASANDGLLNLYGNWSNTNETFFKEGNSIVNFIGSTIQTIANTGASNTERFHDFTINNTQGINAQANISLESAVSNGSNFNLTNGVVRMAANKTFTMTDNATVISGANLYGVANIGKENAYVDGKMEWQWDNRNDERIFPTGYLGIYGPIAVSPRNNVSKSFTAQYFNYGYDQTGYYPINQTQTPILDYVSGLEWWDVNCSLTTANDDDNAKIRLYWRGWSDVSSDAYAREGLKVAHFTGGLWQHEGYVFGTEVQIVDNVDKYWGSVRSDWFTSYSPITLGTAFQFNALPVELISFTARKENENNARLNWATAQERNSAYYDVEHSVDAIHFNTLGRVSAQGNSTTTHDYTFLDDNSREGVNYYRLRQVDVDGSFTYTNIVAVQFDKAGNHLEVYPNPSASQLTVNLAYALEQEADLEVFDQLGRLVLSRSIMAHTSQFNLDLSGLAEGYYVLRVNAGGVYLTERITKRD